MKRHEAFPSAFLAKEDAPHPFQATIAKVDMQTIQSDHGEESKPVMYFQQDIKSLILNGTNWDVCEAAYGPDTEMWTGRVVELFTDPSVKFRGKMVGGLRLRIPSAQQALPPTAAPLPTAPPPAVPLGEESQVPFDERVAVDPHVHLADDQRFLHELQQAAGTRGIPDAVLKTLCKAEASKIGLAGMSNASTAQRAKLLQLISSGGLDHYKTLQMGATVVQPAPAPAPPAPPPGQQTPVDSFKQLALDKQQDAILSLLVARDDIADVTVAMGVLEAAAELLYEKASFSEMSSDDLVRLYTQTANKILNIPPLVLHAQNKEAQSGQAQTPQAEAAAQK